MGGGEKCAGNIVQIHFWKVEKKYVPLLFSPLSQQRMLPVCFAACLPADINRTFSFLFPLPHFLHTARERERRGGFRQVHVIAISHKTQTCTFGLFRYLSPGNKC